MGRSGGVRKTRGGKEESGEESRHRGSDDPGTWAIHSKKDGWKGGPEKSVTFARDIADVVTIESWKKYELW